ncbi:MAG: endonuclease IV, partial [Clostridiales bacterium]|nr:endonuclease IV [Clostridiales bacterium]
YPCFDFGHINGFYGGSLKTEEDYAKLFALCRSAIGDARTNRMHVHFSKIQYGASGEIRHLTFADEVYGPEFAPLAAHLKKEGLEPVVICESDGTQAEDAEAMREMFNGTTGNLG